MWTTGSRILPLRLTEKIWKDVYKRQVLDLAVFIHEFQYPFDKETAISYEGIYQKLKQEPIFYGASDILEQDTVLG